MATEKWLSSPPLPNEVFSLNKDGTGKYIPYEIIVDKLYYLCGHQWSIKSFTHLYYTLQNRRTIVSGQVELEVEYELKGLKIKRILSGAATFVLRKSSNPHLGASIKSLAVMNAVKPLGKQFGWKLNEGEESVKPENGLIDQETKPIMDMVILKKYEKAIKEQDTITIDNIKAQYHVED